MLYTENMMKDTVFTEYEQSVIRQIAIHRVRPNSVQLLDRRKPVVRLPEGPRLVTRQSVISITRMGSGRPDQDDQQQTTLPALRKSFADSNSAASMIFESCYLPISQLDRFEFLSVEIMFCECSVATTGRRNSGAQLIIPSLILADVTTSMTLLSRHTRRIVHLGYSSKPPENLPHILPPWRRNGGVGRRVPGDKGRGRDIHEGVVSVHIANCRYADRSALAGTRSSSNDSIDHIRCGPARRRCY